MLSLISFLIIGVIVGALGRLIVPGENPMAWWATLGLGVAGALVGGFLTRAVFGEGRTIISFIVSVIVAAALVWALAAYQKRSGSAISDAAMAYAM